MATRDSMGAPRAHLTGPILGHLHGVENRLQDLRDDQRAFHLALGAFLVRHGLHAADDLTLHTVSAGLLQRLDGIREAVAAIRAELSPARLPAAERRA